MGWRTLKRVGCVQGGREEFAEEVRQEIIRIIKSSRKPKDNLTAAERRALLALKASEALTVLADKGNPTVVLDTADYNLKIAALLEDQAYKMMKKYPTEPLSARLFFS
jgi:hypothetical protein